MDTSKGVTACELGAPSRDTPARRGRASRSWRTTAPARGRPAPAPAASSPRARRAARHRPGCSGGAAAAARGRRCSRSASRCRRCGRPPPPGRAGVLRVLGALFRGCCQRFPSRGCVCKRGTAEPARAHLLPRWPATDELPGRAAREVGGNARACEVEVELGQRRGENHAVQPAVLVVAHLDYIRLSLHSAAAAQPLYTRYSDFLTYSAASFLK
jgi:hypothetical protein